MKLTIFERVTLLQVLPKEGDFVTLRVLRELKKVVGFSEEDYKTYEIVQKGDRVSWNTKGNEETEVEIGDRAMEISKTALLELNKNKKLKEEHYSIYEKFVQDKGDK